MDMDRRRRRLLRSSRASQSSRTRRTFRADNLTTVETSTWASQRGIPTKAASRDLAAHDVDLIFAAGTTGEFTTQLTRDGSMSARRRPMLGQRPDLLAGRRRLAVPGHATGRGGRRPGAAKLAVLTPYYFAAIGSAILSYYDAILAHAVGVPFMRTCSLHVPQPQPPTSS